MADGADSTSLKKSSALGNIIDALQVPLAGVTVNQVAISAELAEVKKILAAICDRLAVIESMMQKPSGGSTGVPLTIGTKRSVRTGSTAPTLAVKPPVAAAKHPANTMLWFTAGICDGNGEIPENLRRFITSEFMNSPDVQDAKDVKKAKEAREKDGGKSYYRAIANIRWKQLDGEDKALIKGLFDESKKSFLEGSRLPQLEPDAPDAPDDLEYEDEEA